MKVRHTYIQECFVSHKHFYFVHYIIIHAVHYMMRSVPTICYAPVLPVIGISAAMAAY